MKTAAIVLAGGSGARMGQEFNKMYLPIGGRPMLAYSLETMGRSPAVDRVVLVVRDADRAAAELLSAQTLGSTPVTLVTGGATRHQSEQNGMEMLAPAIRSGEVGLVAIHDGARPLLTLSLLDLIIKTADRFGGAIPGLPFEHRLYRAEDVSLTLLPTGLVRAQTPQVFRAPELLGAFRAAATAGFEGVDTAETVERFSGIEVRVVPGDPENIKVTFGDDLLVAAELALVWEKRVGPG